MNPDYAPRLLAVIAVAALATVAVVVVIGADGGRLAEKEKPVAIERSPLPVTATNRSSLPALPPEISAAGDWPLANGDFANARQARGSTIDSGNVRRLGVAWMLPLRGASKWGAAASCPLISGGVVYFQDLRSNVWALDESTGRVRWQHYYDQKAFGPNGPALGWGRVFAQDGRHDVVALDAGGGRELWRTPLAGPTGQQQPVAYGETVFTGIAAGLERPGTGDVLKTALLKGGASGYAYGLDAASGRRIWQ